MNSTVTYPAIIITAKVIGTIIIFLGLFIMYRLVITRRYGKTQSPEKVTE